MEQRLRQFGGEERLLLLEEFSILATNPAH